MNVVQQYKLVKMKADRLPRWEGDWANISEERIQIAASIWQLRERMTRTEQVEVTAWEKARKVATA